MQLFKKGRARVLYVQTWKSLQIYIYIIVFAGIFLREKSNGQNVSYANIFIKKRKEMNTLNMPKTSFQRYATQKLVTTEGGPLNG